MNNHYTGYELELNHAHEANIRDQFERQALAKSLNKTGEIEGLSQTPKQPWRLNPVKMVSIIGLFIGGVGLAFSVLIPLI